MSNVYDDIADELLGLLKPGFGGMSRPDFVARIDRLVGELERLSNSFGYVMEKAGDVREWVGIACSPARHRPWGLEEVEQHAYQGAHRLKTAKSLFTRA